MKLELSLHALKLPNVAGSFKGTSDPFAVVTVLATSPDAQPKALGKTEVIQNTLNPRWVQVFNLDYELGTPLKVAVNVFDEIKKGNHRSMGSAIFDIDDVLGARGNTKAKRLKNGGSIFVNIRKSAGNGVLRLQLKGSKLKNLDGMFGKSDPFFELSRKVENAGGLTWDNVYRSKAIMNNLDPTWEVAVVELSVLCGGDLDSPILMEVFDFEENGKHKLIGKTEMSINGLKNALTTKMAIKLKNKNKDCGTLFVQRCDIEGVTSPQVASVTNSFGNVSLSSSVAGAGVSSSTGNMYANVVPLPPPIMPPPSAQFGSPGTANNLRNNDLFVDYVSGGCEMNVVVAIDFTGSNGDPRKPGTLHYMGGHDRNDYQKAIAAIVSVLSKFDSDQMYPVYGFGAKYGGVVRHCFQCGPTAEVHGVAGVLDAYSQVFRSGLVMSGPTLFNEVIDTAAARARVSLQRSQQSRGMQSYTILLILTDGAVSDPAGTAACLDRAVDAPLSVVIVGVGDADFSSMKFLDDLNTSTNTRGGGRPTSKRDIVQFVEFNKHKHSSISLTSETLHEIPTQLSSYFQNRGISPLPPIQRTDSILSNIAPADEHEIDLSLDIRDDEVVVTGGGNDFVDGFNASR